MFVQVELWHWPQVFAWSFAIPLESVDTTALKEIGFSHSRKFHMRLLIALILPWLTFFTIGRPLAGIICLILQITLIGWLPATIWAVYALSQYKTDQKIEKALGGRS